MTTRLWPLGLVLIFGCGSETAPAQQPFTGDPWPGIRQDRIQRLLPQAMEAARVDAWLVICRENNNDPLARHVGCENAGGTAAFMFFLTGGAIHSVAISPAGESTALAELQEQNEVVSIERGTSIWSHIVAQLERHQPESIAINISRRAAADGLSYSQFQALSEGIGPEWMTRTESSERLVVEWLSVKTSSEIRIMARAAALTAQWEEEAYAEVVPGVTRDVDVATFLETRMAEAGVTDGWSPAQNPAVNSGRDRGHSHPTDRVIQPGDFIQIDFGIKVHDMWVTDIQRFAYVLAPGETEAPPDALAKWEAAKRGSRAAFAAMRPGVTGATVDRAQRLVLQDEGSLPVMWGTGHPVGYWAHDVGPGLSGGRLDRELPGAEPACHLVELNSVYFQAGESFLTEDHRRLLQENLEALEFNPDCAVHIVGSLDSVEAEDTPDLGRDRANAVIQFYAGRGLPADRLSGSRGETESCIQQTPGCSSARRADSIPGDVEGALPRGPGILREGMTFAFDGFYSWALDGLDTKTISVEEMVVITEDGAEWMTPPQEDLILIPSR